MPPLHWKRALIWISYKVVDDADVDSANPEILTVEENEDGNKDDDVEQ